MATTLYDKNGQQVQVDDAHLTQALVSGTYGTDKDVVPVKTVSGTVYNIPVANLGKFSQSQGGKIQVLSDAQLAEHQQQKRQAAEAEKFGGLGSQLAAAGSEALSTATFGGSDFALDAVLSDQQKQDLAAAKRANPMSTTAGGVAGALLPLVATGGASAPEEGAALLGEAGEAATEGGRISDALRGVVTAPMRAADSVSGFVERGINKGMASMLGPEAQSVAGAVARKGIARAGGDAVVGALTTGSQELGEDQLSGDHSLTGEQLAQHMLLSGLMGGTVGGFFGAAHELGDRLAPRLDRKADDMLFDFLGGKHSEDLKSEVSEIADRKTLKEIRSELLDNNVIGKGDKLEDVVPKFQNFADAQRGKLQALTAPIADQEATNLGEVFEKLDAVKDKDLLPSLTRGKAPIDGLKDDIAKIAGFTPGDLKPQIITSKRTPDEIREYLKTGAWDGVSDPSIKRETIVPKSEAEQLEATKLSVQQLQSITAAIGKKAAGNEQLLGVQKSLDDLVSQKLETLGMSDAVTAAKKVQATDAMANAAAKTMENHPNAGHGTLGDAIGHAAVGAALNSTIGHALHGAAHAASAFTPHGLGLLAAHAGAKVAKQLVQERGQSVAIHMLDALSSAKAVMNAQRRYSTSMARGIAALTSSNRDTKRASFGDFELNSKAVKSMLSDPQGHTANISAAAASLGPRFQTVGSSFQKTAIASSLYLAQKLPRSTPIDPTMPNAGSIKPSPGQQAAFNSIFEAVHDPIGILHAASAGMLTKDMVDAVAATHPATLKDIQTKVTAELKTLKEPLAPVQAAQVKMILGQPIFDHPIQMAPPAPPPQGGSGKRAKSATSRPLKIDVNSSVGLPGSRIPKS